MSKVTNLNRARKAKARAEKKARADQNVALHGLTKAEKDRAKAEAERAAKAHQHARLDKGSET